MTHAPTEQPEANAPAEDSPPGGPVVAIVCKNSAKTIGRTLDSVAGWAGAVLAIDSGSTDATMDMLRAHGAKIIEHDWLGHKRTKQLALERSAALRGAGWVLSLDADESVEPELRDAILHLLRSDPADVIGARVNRKVFYRGRFLNHAWQPERRLRLVRASAARSGAVAWGGIDPHDALLPTPAASKSPERVVDLEGTLRHDSFDRFADQLAKDMGYARMMADNLYDRGVRSKPLRVVTSPAGAFAKQMFVKQAWRDGVPGWCAAASVAASTLLKHIMLVERTYLERTESTEQSTGSDARSSVAVSGSDPVNSDAKLPHTGPCTGNSPGTRTGTGTRTTPDASP